MIKCIIIYIAKRIFPYASIDKKPRWMILGSKTPIVRSDYPLNILDSKIYLIVFFMSITDLSSLSISNEHIFE